MGVAKAICPGNCPPSQAFLEYWRPGWGSPSREEWAARQRELVGGEKWIMDGTHKSTMELRFQAADLVIFLDINRPVCLARVVARTGKKRPDMPQFLEERYGREFFQFCRRLWGFPRDGKRVVLGLHQKYPHKPFLVVKGRRRLDALLCRWRANSHDRVKGGPAS